MRCKFPNKDLSQRLDSTICRYDGRPYYVRYRGDNLLDLQTLERQRSVLTIKADDPLFDVSGIPLGYVQVTKENVCYVTRKASRIYKQGVTADTLVPHYMTSTSELHARFSPYSQAFEDMIMERYPSLDSAIEMLRSSDTHREIAISRDVALKWNANLRLTYVYYKSQQVGFIIEGTRKVIIPSGDLSWIISTNLSGFNWEVE